MESIEGSSIPLFILRNASLSPTWPVIRRARARFAVTPYVDTMAYPFVDVVAPHPSPSNDIAAIQGSLSP